MNRPCSQCGTEMNSGWSFCPHCGRAGKRLDASATPIAGLSESAGPAPEEGTAPHLGMIYGAVISIVLISCGVALYISDTGMLVGLPLILAGVLTPLALFSLREQQGACPACGVRVLTGSDHNPHACPHCGQLFAVDEHHAAHPA